MSYQNIKSIIILFAFSFSLLSCTGGEEKAPVVQTELTTPIVTWPLTRAQQAQVLGLNDFGLRLLASIYSSETSKSVFFSPLSISYCMGMLSSGAIGDARNEITIALGFRSGDAQSVDDLCASLVSGLNSDDKKNGLVVANALFYDESLKLKESYINRITRYYEAECASLDFSLESAVDSVNSWCYSVTNGQIPRIIDMLSPAVPVCMLSGVTFENEWQYPFSEGRTSNQAFLCENSTMLTLPMLKQVKKLNYIESNGFQVVRLPYADNDYAMLLLLPRKGTPISKAIEGISASIVSDISKSLLPTKVSLMMPRFKMDCDINLMPHINKQGISSVFNTSGVQLPDMTDQCVNLNTVLHKSHIQVNESGTKAAGVTVVTGETSDTHSQNGTDIITFDADHPFIFLITENKSSIIAFAGVFTGIGVGNK